jgi:hypothetical protein
MPGRLAASGKGHGFDQSVPERPCVMDAGVSLTDIEVPSVRITACSLALFAVATCGTVRADLVALWTFEANAIATNNSATFGPIAANSGTGTASGVHASALTDWSSPAGNGSPRSFSSNEWAVGDYYQFQTSTVGYQGVSFSFDATSSNTGPRDFQIQYSTNGTTFTPLTTYSVLANATPNPVWNGTTASSLYNFSFNLPAAVNNQAAILLRLVDNSTVSANGGVVAAAGTSRVDNVMINAVAVPEPSAVCFGLLVCGVVAGGAAWRRYFG